MSISFKRKTPDNWKEEEVNWEAYNKSIRNREGYIMFPSTHDITPEHLDLAIDYLKRLLGAGNKVLIVSKPSFTCIKKICDTFTEYKEQILFRFTIGSKNSNTLNFWEPNAPDYNERKKALVYAFEVGYQTSISCEPMLDNKIDKVIEDLPQYCKIIRRKHEPEKFRYIDLFAGPGIYEDGNVSTPIMLARNIAKEPSLKDKVQFVFNDLYLRDELQSNFESEFPTGTFQQGVAFLNREVGEDESIYRALERSTMRPDV